MTDPHWNTFYRSESGLVRKAESPAASVAPATNFHVSQMERIHRAAFPQPAFDVGYIAPFWKPPKEEEQVEPESAAVESTATDEQPPVIVPPQRDLRAEVAELLRPAVEYLERFAVIEPPDDFEAGYNNPLARPEPQSKPPEAVEFEARKTALLADLRTWTDSLRQFLESHRSWMTAELQQQHASAWHKAREQKAVVQAIIREHDATVVEMRRLDAARSKARLLASSHGEVRPDMDALPSQADLDKWQLEDEQLQAAWKSAEAAIETLQEHRRNIGYRYERERIKLATLRKAEIVLRAKLSGQVIPPMGLQGEESEL